MEALNEFINKNPDVPVKVRLVTVVFFILTFTLTRALLSSLVLTALYTVLHTLILFVIRRNKLLELSDVHDRKQDLIGDDSDEEDFTYEPGKLGYFGGSDAQYEVVQRKPAFAHKTDLGTSLRIESKVRPTPDRYFRQNPTNAFVGFDSKYHQEKAKEFDFEDRPMYGERTAKGFEMYRKPPNSNELSSIGVNSKSPKTPNFFGVNRWGLSRQPLHPTAINTPLTSESMHFAGQKRNAKPTRASMFHKLKGGYGSDQNISPSGPQTSSPFHDKSQVGLWDTMSLSAIAGSPTNFISPINSPGIVGEKNSLQNVLVSSPSSEKGLGFSRKHVPRHTTGHPVDVKRHPQPLNVVSSQWQKWSHKQTTVTVGGRPKLQSPVTVRIAHPDRPAASLSMSRSYRTPLGSEETSESLRKDVILSALREKRKRGKAVENQSVNRDDQSSLEDTQTGSHIKKRRLNNTEDISEPSAGPVRRHSRSGATGKRGLTSSPAVTDSYVTGRSNSDSREILDSSYGSMTSKSCGRNAIESSLSSSRMWKQNNLKRSLQSDEREAVSVVPPKKVSRATDVSGLISDGKRKDLEKSKETAVEEVEASNEEKLEENGHTKLGIPPRLRKRAVFTTIHRGKQAKPPSPNQITAADLNEDRQRARERIRLMRQLLRDETAPTKETPKDADKPLLPVAKSPPTASSSSSSFSSGLLSTTSAFPTVSSSMTAPNQTDVDGSSKSTKSKGLLDQLLKKDPITKKLAEEAKKNLTPPKSSLSNTSSGLSFFNATTTTTKAKTSALSVSISNPPPSSSSSPSKPNSLLQALSGMRPTTQPDQTPPVTTLSSSGGLGFQIGQSNQANTVTTSLLPSAIPTTFSSSTDAAIMTGTSNGATKTTAAAAVAQPTFSFGSSSLSGTSSAQVLSTPAQPSFQFGSLTSSSASQVSFKPPADPPKPVAAQPSFSFGAASSNPLISGAQTQVSGASQPLANAPVSSSNAFSFGNPAGSKQSTTGSNMPSFGTTSAAPSNQTTNQNKVSFGTSAPTFSFGATTTVQQPGPSSSFSFGGGGGVTAAASTQSSTTPSAGQFTFGAKASSSTVPLSMFQQTPSQVAATAPSASTGTSSPFTFGGATTKPASFSTSTAASSAVAPPSYNFGSQPTASAGFSFGSNQSKPPSQGSLFSSSQPSQASGFSFGSQSAAPAPLFPAASATPPQRQQQQQQAGFAFGNQQSQPTGLFQSSTSAPSLNFGAGNQATPSASSSFFQFGGSTGGAPQQQTTPSSNFPGNPSKFPFGSGTSTPQFGQGQDTPSKPQSKFSMGTSSAPKKTASARMRQRARISRR